MNYKIYLEIYYTSQIGFTQESILEYAHNSLPNLLKFNICIVNQSNEDEDLLASNTDNNLFKSYLYQNINRPKGMLVYE